MIRLKNGFEVKYEEDFDLFFTNLLESIIKESQKAVKHAKPDQEEVDTSGDLFLKEVMDNCIYVTHQLFELAKTNENLSKFIVTGFLFNSAVIILPHLEKLAPTSLKKNIIH